MLPVLPQALLALADGTVFQGVSIGAAGHTVGEVVFNTSLTGYQEILTDPSYCQQIVTLTYPHIGNYGVNAEDAEASKVHAAGLIIKDLPILASNFRQNQTLSQYLQSQGTVAIAGIDTRQLTRLLRSKGAQNGVIVGLPASQTITDAVVADAVAKAKAAPSMAGLDLAQVVSRKDTTEWTQSEWRLDNEQLEGRPGFGTLTSPRFHVVAYDFGVKRNILRLLAEAGCDVTVVPATTSAEDILALKPDGVFLSNGPGDPAPCDYAIEAARTLMDSGVPTFGICLGHQIMALASGAKTFKMKFGHHGANHPVKDLTTGKVVAAICHAPWPLIEVGAAKGRDLTSFSSIRTDVINAGGRWHDKAVVTDQGIVTSRNPGDLDAFCAKIIEEIQEGGHGTRQLAA